MIAVVRISQDVFIKIRFDIVIAVSGPRTNAHFPSIIGQVLIALKSNVLPIFTMLTIS